ncbi:MAG: LUD domain-containing protein [Acidimicrobiales bacterium]|jgi:iron-sulfur cluster protein
MARTFAGSPDFPVGAKVALADPQLRSNLSRATRTIRDKRNLRVSELDTWEELRLAGEAIKREALANLHDLLVTFEKNVTNAGGHVHWAIDAAHAQRIVVDLVKSTGAHDVVKIKTMTSAEIDLNSALEIEEITAYETDLAELIVQLGDDLPSHIVVPAIHRNRDEVRAIFLEHMGEWGLKAPDDLTNVPSDLAKAARLHLRERFLASRVGVSGANFLVAETGSVVIVESEGNGRMCLTLPHTLISVAGIDKVIPRFEDLDVFFQVLPRSATGERMNPYNSIWTGVTKDDGPQDFHVVLIDNGRSNALSDRVGREALRCIRCAACLNVCPVYERVGGHAYGSVYPGPIGAILTPQLNHVTSDHVAMSLPYASTLCGACFDACPVRIDIPKLLVHLRGEVVNAKRSTLPTTQEQVGMRAASWVFANSSRLRAVTSLGAKFKVLVGNRNVALPGWLSGWSRFRSVPVPKRDSFATWWRRERGDDSSSPSSPPHPRSLHRSEHHRSEPHAAGIRAESPATHVDQVTAREAILSSVRFANRAAPTTNPVSRSYRRPARAELAAPVDLFAERVSDYQATVTFTTNARLSDAINVALVSRGSRSLVFPEGAPRDWLTHFEGTTVIDKGQLELAIINQVDAVVTGCTAGIAETGTVVLNSEPNQGRRIITLIPDHHVVIIREDQIVPDVPDVIEHLNPARPQTWISGPSATSDIELSRVEGVHGPRQLDVIIVRG